jgi:hypothetical protein
MLFVWEIKRLLEVAVRHRAMVIAPTNQGLMERAGVVLQSIPRHQTHCNRTKHWSLASESHRKIASIT